MVLYPELLNRKRFLPVFGVQFLNALSDQMLRYAVLVMIAYHGFLFLGLPEDLSVNIVSLLFILPLFLFSSYAGKLAGIYNKVHLIRVIKYCEILIMLFAFIGFKFKSMELLVIALIAMGVHSTFFGPIKYSILPQIIKEQKVLLAANGYVELGTFMAILIGQTLGSWYMANQEVYIIITLLSISTMTGLYLSYKIENVMVLKQKEKFHWNFLKDTYTSYREVAKDKNIKLNIHALSWFWGSSMVISAQLPVFCVQYINISAHVFSILLAILSIAIGVGSLVCVKLSRGQIKHRFIPLGAIGVAVFTIILLALNPGPDTPDITLLKYSLSLDGVITYTLVFLLGISAGFFSVTGYNELQVYSKPQELSKIIGVNNFLNASYMLLVVILCSILLLFTSTWHVLAINALANIVFAFYYIKVKFYSLTANKT